MGKDRSSEFRRFQESVNAPVIIEENIPQAQNAGIQPAPQGVGQSSLGFGQETEQTASTPIGGGDILPELASSIWKKTKEAVAQAYKDPTKEFLALGGSVISEFQALMTDLPNSINDAIQGGAIRARLKETQFTDQDLVAFGNGPNGEKLTIDEAKERKRDFLVNNALRNPVADAMSGYATRKLIGKYFDSRPDENGDPTGFDKFLGVGKEQVVGKSIGSVASMALGGWAGKAAKIPKLGQAFMFNMEFQGYMDDVKEQRGDAAMSDPTTLASGLIYATISSVMEQKMGLNPLEIGAGKVAKDAIRKGALQAAEEVTASALGSTVKGGFLRGAGRAVVNTGADALQEMSQQGASDLIKTTAEYFDAGSTDNPLKGVMTDPKKQREVLSKYAENAVGAFFGSGVFSTIRSASGEKEANNAAYDYIRNGVGDLRTLPQQVAGMFVPSELSGEGAKSISARADLVKKSAIEDSEVEIEKVKGLPIAEEEKAARITQLEETRDKAVANIDSIANLAINVPSRVGEAGSFQAFQILEKQKALKDLIKVDETQLSDPTLNNAVGQLNDSDIKAREELMGIYDKQLKEIGKDGATTIDKKEQALLRQVGLSEYAEPLLDKKDSKVEGIVNEGMLLNDETSFVAPNGKTFVKDNGQWVGLEKISEADSIDNVDPVTGVKTKEAIPAKYRVDTKFDATDKQDNIQAAYEASGSAKRVQGEVDAETRRVEQEELKKEQDAKAELDKQIKETNDELARIKKEKKEAQDAELKELRIESARLTNEAKRAGIKAKEKAALEREAKAKNDEAAAIESAEYKKDEREIKYEKLLQDLYNAQDLAVKKIDEVQSRINVNEEKLETQKARTEQVKNGKPKSGNTDKSTFGEALADREFKKFFDTLEPHIMYGLQVQDVPWETVSDISLDENDENGNRAMVEIPGFGWAFIPFELVDGNKVFKYFIAKGIDEYSEEDLLHFPFKGEVFAVIEGENVSINKRNPGVRVRVAKSSLAPDGKQTDKKSPDLTKREGILKGIKKAFESGSSGSDAVKEAVTLIYENYKNGLVALNIGDVAHIANKIADQGEVWSGELDARFIELFNLGMDLGSPKKEAAFAKLAKEMGMNVGKMVSDIALSTVIDKAQAVRDIVINQAFKDGLLTDVKIRELKNRQLNEKPTIVDGKDRGAEYTGRK